MEPANTPVVFVHGLWLHATRGAPGSTSSRMPATRRSRRAGPVTRTPSRRPGVTPMRSPGNGIDDVVEHYAGIDRGPGQADRHRALVRRADRPASARARISPPQRSRSTRRRSRASLPAAVRAAGRLDRAARTRRTGTRRGCAHPGAVPLRVRQRAPAAESAELYDALRDPVARASRCSRRRSANFAAAVARQGRHAAQDARAVADHRRRARTTRCRRGGRARRRGKLYHTSPAVTDLREFPDRGHSSTIDHGWRDVAQEALNWLQRCLR